jgi:hypothetical protein
VNPGLVRKIGQAHGTSLRERVARREHDAQRFLEQDLEDDARIRGKGDVVVFEDDREVELAGGEAGEGRQRVGLGHRHLHVGTRRAEAHQCVRDDAHRRRRDRAEPQRGRFPGK